ncbi:hypothetical protein ACLOJK_020464 [Asimina triloba]
MDYANKHNKNRQSATGVLFHISMDFLLSSPHLLLPCLCLFFFFSPCTSTDTLLPTHNHKDGETIVSAGKTFALGFFSPGNTTNRYVGIWLQNIPDENVVWVANRENPLPNASGVVTITHNSLVILDESRRPIWSVTLRRNATSARLLDSGNLVLNDSQGRMLWQSFNYPTNTMLPGLKIGIDYRIWNGS